MTTKPALTGVSLFTRDYNCTHELIVATSNCRRHTLHIATGDAMTEVAARLRQLAQDIDPQPVVTNEWRD